MMMVFYNKNKSKLVWESNIIRKDFWFDSFFDRGTQFFTNIEFSKFLKNTFPIRGPAFWILEELDWTDYNLQRIRKLLDSKPNSTKYKKTVKTGFDYKNLLDNKYHTLALADSTVLSKEQEDIYKKAESTLSDDGVDLILLRQFTVQSNLRWLFATDFINRLVEGDKLYSGVSQWASFFFKAQQKKQFGGQFSKFRNFAYSIEQSQPQVYFYFLSKKNIMFFSNFSKLSLFYRILNSPFIYVNRNKTLTREASLHESLNYKPLNNYNTLTSFANFRYPYYWEKNFFYSEQLTGFKKKFAMPAIFPIQQKFLVTLVKAFHLDNASDSCFLPCLRISSPSFFFLEYGLQQQEIFFNFTRFHPSWYSLESLNTLTKKKLITFLILNNFRNTSQIINSPIAIPLHDTKLVPEFYFGTKYKDWINLHFFGVWRRFIRNVPQSCHLALNTICDAKRTFNAITWYLPFNVVQSLTDLWVTTMRNITYFYFYFNSKKRSLVNFFINSTLPRFPIRRKIAFARIPKSDALFLYNKKIFNITQWFLSYEIIVFEWKENINDFFIFIIGAEFWAKPIIRVSEVTNTSNFRVFYSKFLYSTVYTPRILLFKKMHKLFISSCNFYNLPNLSAHNCSPSLLHYNIFSGFLALLTRRFTSCVTPYSADEKVFFNHYGLPKLNKFENIKQASHYNNNLSDLHLFHVFSKVPIFIEFVITALTQIGKFFTTPQRTNPLFLFYLRYFSRNYKHYNFFLRMMLSDGVFLSNGTTNRSGTLFSLTAPHSRLYSYTKDALLLAAQSNSSAKTFLKYNLSTLRGAEDKSFLCFIYSNKSGKSTWLKEFDIYFTSSKDYFGYRTSALPLIKGGLSSAHAEFFFFILIKITNFIRIICEHLYLLKIKANLQKIASLKFFSLKTTCLIVYLINCFRIWVLGGV